MPSRVAPPLSIAALYAQRGPAASPSKLETGRLRTLRSRAASLRTGFVFGRNVHAVARNEFTIAPFTAPHVPWRTSGETFAPVSTSRCGSCSCLNCFTIVGPAGVAVQSHSAWALEFLIRVSSAEKSVDVGEKIVVSTISRPYFFASFETWAGPSRPYPPLSPMSHTRLTPTLLRYAASLYAYRRAVAVRVWA